MKIVCISDTHMMHNEIVVPEGDILIHAGDFTDTGTQQQIIQFNRWLSALPHKHKVVIAGNHDFLFQHDPGCARELLSSAIYLQDSEATVEGLRIYGSPWQPKFYNWAFNLARGADLKRKWDLIPEGIDVLVTHGPPYGRRDLTPRGENVGCDQLSAAVGRVKPRLHVFGHIHAGYGQDGIFVNASICDESYNPGNKPIVVEL